MLHDRLYAPVDRYWAPGNRIVQNGYRDIAFPFLPVPMPCIEMTMKWNADQLADYFSTWSAVKLYDNENRSDIVETFRPQLREIISGMVNVSFDFGVYAGRR